MSDFAGMWRLDREATDPKVLSRMGQALEARGIGKARVYCDRQIGLVHRQHVFTLEDLDEDMPLVGASGAALVADCRLTEREALAAMLGVEARQYPDGALILLGYERWGADVIQRLRGCFSFAIWDAVEQRLILARDHAGQRTLYWYRGKKIIAFGNRLRPLLTLEDVPDALDEQAVADFLILNNGHATRTIYRAIDRVPAAHIVIVDRAGVRSWRHWTQPEAGSLRLRSDAEYDEAARDVIDRTVADTLRSRGPVTLALTGGLDTVTIAESAVRQKAPSRILAVTRIPGEAVPSDSEQTYHDEGDRVAELAAAMPGLDWHRVRDDGGDWGEADERQLILQGGMPNRAALNIAWFFPVYRFMADRGSRVMIGGEFGNSFYSSTGLEFLPSLLAAGRWGTVLRETKMLARQARESWPRSFLRHAVRPYEPLALRQWRGGENLDAPWAAFSAINPAFAGDMGLAERVTGTGFRMRINAGARRMADLRDWMLGDEVANDGWPAIRALSGVDNRIPLADRRVLDFFGSLPHDQFLRDGVTRRIARRMIAGRVPNRIAHGLRRGMQNGDWFRIQTARRSEMISDVEALRSHPLVSRLIDLDRIAKLLHDWPRDADHAERRRTEYLQLIDRGVSMARFLAWHSRIN